MFEFLMLLPIVWSENHEFPEIGTGYSHSHLDFDFGMFLNVFTDSHRLGKGDVYTNYIHTTIKFFLKD